MHTAEVVPHEIERHGGRVILGRTVCYLVEGDEGLALTVECGGDIVLAEMVADLDVAIRRANVVRDTLLAAGLKPVTESFGDRDRPIHRR